MNINRFRMHLFRMLAHFIYMFLFLLFRLSATFTKLSFPILYFFLLISAFDFVEKLISSSPIFPFSPKSDIFSRKKSPEAENESEVGTAKCATVSPRQGSFSHTFHNKKREREKKNHSVLLAKSCRKILYSVCDTSEFVSDLIWAPIKLDFFLFVNVKPFYTSDWKSAE